MQKSQYQFLDLLAAAMVPQLAPGPEHGKDPPPVERLLPPGLAAPDLLALLDFFVAADHDVRTDRFVAAARNLDLAETRIRLVSSQSGLASAACEAALRDIVLARDAAGGRDSAHACGAIADAVRALAATQPRH